MGSCRTPFLKTPPSGTYLPIQNNEMMNMNMMFSFLATYLKIGIEWLAFE
jgi:hypothetical protein